MKALLVDDNSNNLSLFQIILERKGFQVVTAVNGEDALKKLHGDTVDIIVSDILMPVMDGFHLLQECKSDIKLKNIPFAFVTGAFLDARDEELALKLGVQAFIRKPVEPNDFVNKLEEILAREPAPRKRGRPPKERKDGDAEKLVSINLMQKLESKMVDLEEEIVERKKTEEALRISEEQYRLLFETMAQGVIYFDADGTVISVNPAGEKILGLSEDQIVGRNIGDPIWRFISEDGADVPPNKRPSAMAQRTGKLVSDVVLGVFNPVDNMYHWVSINAQPQFREGEDKPFRVFATFDDITDRFLSYKAMQESESRITAIMENTRDSIWSVDAENRLITTNNAARELFLVAYGVDLEEGIGVFADLPEETRESWTEISKRGFQGEHFTFERHYDFDNGPIDLQISVNPIISPAGQVTGVSFFGRDMTQQHKAEKALEESEVRYRMLIENAAEEIYVIQDGLVKFSKPGISRITGYSGQEIMSKSLSEMIHPDDLVNMLEHHAIRMAGGKAPTEYTYRAFDKSGNIRWVGAHVTTITWEGRPATLTFQIDITDRVNLESAVKESEQKYRTVVENAVEAIIILQDGKVKFSNRLPSGQLGYTREELLDMPVLDIIHPDDRQMVAEKYARRLAGEPVEDYAFRALTKEQETVWVELRGVVIEWEGRPATLNFVNNITERKLAEDALRQSEEKYRNILEQMDEAYYEVDSKGNFTFVNDAMCRQMGFTKEEVLSMNYKDYIPVEDVAHTRQMFSEVFRTGTPALWHPFERRKKDGTLFYVEGSIFPIKNDHGETVGLRGITRDVTERKRVLDALRESQEKYRLLVESANEGIHVIQNGIIKFANTKFAEYTGATVEKLIGRRTRELIHPDDLDAAIERYRRRMAGETMTGSFQHRYVAENGKVTWIEVTGVNITWEDRPAVLYFTSDITARKLAEDALRESEEKYRSILEKMQEVYYEMNQQGVFTFFNDALCRLLGYSREELLAMDYKNYVKPEDQAKTYAVFADVWLTKNPRHWVPITLIRKDGTEVYVEDSVYPIIDAKGEVVGLHGVKRDVTGRKQSEEALRVSEEKYRTILEEMDEIYFELDLKGNYVFFNSALCRLTGYSSEELTGLNFRKYMPQDQHDGIRAIFNEIYRTGRPVHWVPITYIRKDGTQAYMEDVVVFPIRNDAGEITGFRGITRDVTEHKKAQDELKFRALLLGSATDSIFVHDFDGNYIYVNEAACKTRGYTREELMSINLRDLLAPELVPMFDMRLQDIRRKGDIIFESAHRCKDGSIINVEAHAHVIELDGKPYVLAVDHDITQRKQNEAALQDSEQRYRSLFEYNPVAVYLQDLEGNFTSVNDATCKLTGYTREEILSTRPEQLIIAEDIKRTRSHFIKASRGESQHYECTIITKSGEKRILSVANLSVIVNNNIVGVYSVAEDVTERNQALEKINSTLEGTIEAIAMMSELRDPYTAGHQKMVTQLAMAIAREMGLSEDQIRALRVAGLLHDVGKVYVPSEILSKPGRLSELERGLAKTHASASYDIVKAIKFPWPVCRIIIQHHERLDGSGYPKGIKGDEIIPEAKILAVADVVEAMTSHRPYRPALGVDKALEEITSQKGVLYDPEAVDACVTLFREKGFKFIE